MFPPCVLFSETCESELLFSRRLVIPDSHLYCNPKNATVPFSPASRTLCQKLAALGQVALYSVVPGRAAFPLGGTAAALLPTKKEQQDKQAQEKQGNEKYSYKYIKHHVQCVALRCSLG